MLKSSESDGSESEKKQYVRLHLNLPTGIPKPQVDECFQSISKGIGYINIVTLELILKEFKF